MTKEDRDKAKEQDAYARNTLSRILTGATLAEKVEAVREFNPYFYLLTPTPKKGK